MADIFIRRGDDIHLGEKCVFLAATSSSCITGWPKFIIVGVEMDILINSGHKRRQM
ncbi:MAG: hypothetical protein GY696_15040 [Gammaproteobacteria bacterium]|nr:hypothetical protein [Gammaproteobacteria bacterium]